MACLATESDEPPSSADPATTPPQPAAPASKTDDKNSRLHPDERWDVVAKATLDGQEKDFDIAASQFFGR